MRRNRMVFLGLVVGVVTGQLLSLSLVYAAQDFSFFDVVWAKGLAIEDDEGNIAIQLTALDDGRGAIHMPQGAHFLLTSPTSEKMMIVEVSEFSSRIMMFSVGESSVGVDAVAGISVDQDGTVHHFPSSSEPGTAAKPTTWGDIKAMQAKFDQVFKR